MRKKIRRSKRNNFYTDLKKLKHAFKNTALDAKNEALDILRDNSTLVRDNINEYTSENPFKTFSIALLTGVAVGYFLHR